GGAERRQAAAHHLTLHAIDLHFPHVVLHGAGGIQAVAGAATGGIETGGWGVRFGQLRPAGTDAEPGHDAEAPSDHVSSRQYAAWPGVSSTPIWMTRICPTPSACSSRRISPTR